MANIEIIDKLIEHYKVTPTGGSWGYSHCAAGVLHEMGLIPYRMGDDFAMSEALGIRPSQVHLLVYHPQDFGPTYIEAHNQSVILAMFEEMKITSKCNWRAHIGKITREANS